MILVHQNDTLESILRRRRELKQDEPLAHMYIKQSNNRLIVIQRMFGGFVKRGTPSADVETIILVAQVK